MRPRIHDGKRRLDRDNVLPVIFDRRDMPGSGEVAAVSAQVTRCVLDIDPAREDAGAARGYDARSPAWVGTEAPPLATIDIRRLEKKERLVAPAGLEPTAYGLGNRRSIQLSYGASPRDGRRDTRSPALRQGY